MLSQQSLLGTERTDFFESIKIFQPSHNPTDSHYIHQYNIIKNAIYELDTPTNWQFGTLLEIAPLTFARSYNSEDAVLADIQAYTQIQQSFDRNKQENSTKIQSPRYIRWYFTFDNITWWLILDFGKIMYGETNKALYKGGIVDPIAFLENKYQQKNPDTCVNKVVTNTKKRITTNH